MLNFNIHQGATLFTFIKYIPQYFINKIIAFCYKTYTLVFIFHAVKKVFIFYQTSLYKF